METPDAAVVVEMGEEVEIVALETGEAVETVEMDCYSETECIPFAIEW